MIGAFLTTVLWSFSAIFARRSTQFMGASAANFYRLALACILLGLYTHLFAPQMERRAFGILFASGVIGLGLGDLALFIALPRLGSRLSLLMVQCLAAPIAALIEWLWLGTTLNLWQILSGLLILIGIAIAFRPSGEVKPDALGIFMGLLAAIGQAGGAVISRGAYHYMEEAGISVNGGSAAYQRMLGGVLISGIYFFVLLGIKKFKSNRNVDSTQRPSEPSDFSQRRKGYLYVIGNTICGPVLGVACYQWALIERSVGVVMPIVATTPLVAIPFTRWLEKDSAGLQAWGGAVLSVAGVAGMILATGN
ncbi:MAG: DMT family transporter [Leptospiraceae bacterium]|nr:DMT family transporter [Leptospiraceae bacterium]MCB1304562.1 DMT family transporter [Leptospiraceae bacterium]